MSRRFIPVDPRWIIARFAGPCAQCGAPIRVGERAFWYPRERRLLCAADACGGQGARDLDAAIQDERTYQSQYPGGY